MLLIPAIDLKNGQCVRLKQGRMEDATIFGDDPVAFAAQWVEQGAERLHLVDLDGAVEGSPKNHAAVANICKAFPHLPIQIGGGIRNESIAARYFDVGVHSVIIGTQAVREPDFVARLCQQFPDQVIVGIDAKDGWVATHGWLEVSDLAAVTLARQFANMGVSAIVYTDIARDGMLQGVNVEATASLARECGIPVIASGGVTDVGDIERLWAVRDSGICGVIIGRALYDGRLSLAEARKIIEQ